MLFDHLLSRLRMDVTSFANVLRALLDSPIWSGRVVDTVYPSGFVSHDVRHGLGRMALGAVVIAVSDTANVYLVVPPTSPTTVTLVPLGGPPGSDVRVRLWVF